MISLLSVSLIIPLIGIVVILCLPPDRPRLIRNISAIATGIQLGLIGQVLLNFNTQLQIPQFIDQFSWIERFSINYFIGVDGINLPLIVIAALVLFITVFIPIPKVKHPKAYFSVYLTFDISLMGVLLSFDLFLFLTFLGMLIFCAYLFISIWSIDSQTDTGSQFALFAFLGFIIIAVGIFLLYSNSREASFNLLTLLHNTSLPDRVSLLIYPLLLIGFGMITPLFPFHSWLLAMVRSVPFPIAVLLLSLFTKIGFYGFIRIALMVLPSTSAQLALIPGIWGLLSLVYFALCLNGSREFENIVSFYTLLQLSFTLLLMSAARGISGENGAAVTMSLSGALFHLFNHSLLIIPFLFMPTLLKNYSSPGKPESIPSLTVYLLFATLLACSAMPGFALFNSLFISLSGIFQMAGIRILGIVAMLAILLMISTFIRLYGFILRKKSFDRISDRLIVDGNVAQFILPLLVIALLLGLIPSILLNPVINTISQLPALAGSLF